MLHGKTFLYIGQAVFTRANLEAEGQLQSQSWLGRCVVKIHPLEYCRRLDNVPQRQGALTYVER